MMEMTVRTLTESDYDADMNQITLIFQDGDSRVMATGTAPEGSFSDENYFDSEDNIKSFLKDAEIEEG